MRGLVSSLARRIRSGTGRVWRAGLDFVYQTACPQCGDEAPELLQPGGLWPRFCDACAGEIAPPVEFACERCGAPVGPYLDTSDGCIHCRDSSFAFERAVCLGAYDGCLRTACLRAKEPQSEPLAAALAHLLWQRSANELREFKADVVVPIPHHWLQRLGRGHDPAATIAGTLARRLGLRCERACLRKVRHTPRQTTLLPAERRVNLRGAFRTGRARRIAGRRFLLVDDVLTTGTTCHRSARELRGAGAAAVVVAVIARGIGRT